MNTQINHILDKFKDQKILVIGDFILDIYLDGTCSRLAPEASVPVLDVTGQTACLGGSANVALNLHNMGAQVCYISMLGQDESAKTAIELFKRQGIHSLCIHFTEQSPTLTKTRLLKDGQLLYRFDVGKKVAATETVRNGFLADIERAYEKCDAVFISDYDKGTITHRVIELLTQLREKDEKVFAVDCKNYEKYKQLSPTMIKPNYQEALQLVKEQPAADRVKQCLHWGDKIWDASHAQLTALSLDKDGVVLSRRNIPSFHYPVKEVRADNVSGAGDTFLSTFLLAHLSGASDYEAVHIACTAASASIQKKTTASCTISELRMGFVSEQEKVIDDLEIARCLSDSLRAGKKIVFTNGCFDIFHSGHAHYLRQARALGDVLVVGINTDESVSRLKGPSRPINTLSDRIEVLKGLQCVDYIIPFGAKENDTPVDVIKAIQPAIFVKGEDYQDSPLPERDILETLGIAIKFLPYVPHQSTTKIIERVQKNKLVVLKKIS